MSSDRHLHESIALTYKSSVVKCYILQCMGIYAKCARISNHKGKDLQSKQNRRSQAGCQPQMAVLLWFMHGLIKIINTLLQSKSSNVWQR